jgi:hypothetical protein
MSAAKHIEASRAPTIDECVRLVTAFNSFADLQDTQASYAPKFYARPMTTLEAKAQHRVALAFNAWVEREQLARPRAFIAGSTT